MTITQFLNFKGQLFFPHLCYWRKWRCQHRSFSVCGISRALLELKVSMPVWMLSWPVQLSALSWVWRFWAQSHESVSHNAVDSAHECMWTSPVCYSSVCPSHRLSEQLNVRETTASSSHSATVCGSTSPLSSNQRSAASPSIWPWMSQPLLHASVGQLQAYSCRNFPGKPVSSKLISLNRLRTLIYIIQ